LTHDRDPRPAANDAGETTVEPPLEPSGAPDLQATLAEVSRSLSRLEAQFELRFAYDATKDAAFRHVYADLQDAKLAQSLESTRPLLLDLLLLYDRVETAIGSATGGDGSALGSFREELLEILHRRDVQRLVSASDRYDRDTQQVVGVVDTVDADDHHRVERIVRPGFRWGTRMLRAEDVIIRRHRPTVAVAEAALPREDQ
jgi:molecular chaperone GrpE (heat shock protein)